LAASAARGRTRPGRSRRAPNGAGAVRRSEGSGHVMTPLPRPRGGSQNPSLPPGAQAPGTHREPTSTGARSREVWEADIGRTYRSVLVGRCVARRSVAEVPSPKETVTPLGKNPDDGGRRREGENGAQVSRVSFTSFARGADSWAEKPAKARHGVRRLGPHARCSLTGTADTRVLGLLVKPQHASKDAGGAAADRAAGADSAVPGDDTRGVRSRSVRGQKAPPAGKNRRRGSASAGRSRGRSRSNERAINQPLLLVRRMHRDVFGGSWGERIAAPTVSCSASAN
jgi:hypothetical protein